jgi:4-hydroxybenzoate polyprenyltransferase
MRASFALTKWQPGARKGHFSSMKSNGLMALGLLRAGPAVEFLFKRHFWVVHLAFLLGVAFFMVLVAYGAHFIWQVRTLKPDDGALALRLFKSNREAGLILLAAIALGGLTVSL